MDFFEAGCQGVGLALAAGMLGGAIAGTMPDGGRSASGRLTIAAAVVLVVFGLVAGYLFGASLDAEDHPAWPGWFVGAALAVLAFSIVRSVVAGASRRAGEAGSPTFIAGMASGAALALGALSLTPASPVSLLALVGLIYVGTARRRKAGEKYEGLRSLRE